MPFRDDLLEPIPGPSPGGIPLRHESVYTQIKEARREDEELPQGVWAEQRKTADPAAVIKLAGDALALKSKDLQLAAWLTEALLRREGFAGLREGLELVRSLIERFWDHLYPELEDGSAEFRATPLSWVGQYLIVGVKRVPLDQAGHHSIDYAESREVPSEEESKGDAEKKKRAAAITAGKATPEEIEQGFMETPKAWYKQLIADLNGSRESLDALEALCREKFAEAEPNFIPLREALEDVKRLAGRLLERKLELEPDPPEPKPEVALTETSTPTVAQAGPKTVTLEPTDARDAAERIAAAAVFLQRHAPTSPASYLLLRGFRWGELRANGGSIDPKLLEAPPTAVRTHLKTLLLDENWPQLLQEGEKVMASPYGRGWLDLQRYVLSACFKLGSEYETVAAAILSALAVLLRDFPQLAQLTLMDDTPTANEETRAWLSETVFGEEAEAPEWLAPATPAGGPVASRPTSQSYDRAMAEVRAGHPEKGIELLMRELERERSERARFLRRSDVAGIMVDSGFESVAMPILKDLLQQIDNHKLEEWEEGETVAKPLGMLHRCIDKVGGESEEVKKNLYRRICKLDPVQAIAFPGNKSQAQAASKAAAAAGAKPASQPSSEDDPPAESDPSNDAQA